MMRIFCSGKLAKFFGVDGRRGEEAGVVTAGDVDGLDWGVWNAQDFFVGGSRQVMLMHGMTRYVVVLRDVRKAQVGTIGRDLMAVLLEQLVYEGLLKEGERDRFAVLGGQWVLLPTNNDKRAIGSLRYFVEGYVSALGSAYWADKGFGALMASMHEVPVVDPGDDRRRRYSFPARLMWEALVGMGFSGGEGGTVQ